MTSEKKRIILTIIYIAFVVFIFSNSLQNADDSSERSGRILGILQQMIPGITEHFIRKAAHFTEFAILGVIGACCMRSWMQILMGKPALWLSAVAAAFDGLLVALTDETIQLFIEGRSGQITDVWIDFFGCCAGIVVAVIANVL